MPKNSVEMTCHKCKSLFSEYTDNVPKNQILKSMKDEGWKIVGGKTYCDECVVGK